MANILIIHGAYGNPNENWFPWLKTELEKLGHKIFVPEFPTPKNQSLKNWMNVFKDYEAYLDENSIVVGHSLGPSFLLSILEKLDKPVKSAFFVSGFINFLNNPNFDTMNKSFIDKNFNWQKIKQNCNKFYIIHSDNDPYVPLNQSKQLATNLDTEVLIIKNGGHFNTDAGYTKFDFILDKITKE